MSAPLTEERIAELRAFYALPDDVRAGADPHFGRFLVEACDHVTELLAEVERLRAELGRYDAMVRDHARWFRLQERELVVTFLRDLPSVLLDEAAGRIERGEHVPEEGA